MNKLRCSLTKYSQLPTLRKNGPRRMTQRALLVHMKIPPAREAQAGHPLFKRYQGEMSERVAGRQ
jgi:hypothetical protein